LRSHAAKVSFKATVVANNYATTKDAIATFIVGLAKLLATQGIRVNVAPGRCGRHCSIDEDPDELEKLGGDTLAAGRDSQRKVRRSMCRWPRTKGAIWRGRYPLPAECLCCEFARARLTATG
jgi:NAD(P)-dependent dehydrogenase (short-subunit alcohol dehydrogenase family)